MSPGKRHVDIAFVGTVWNFSSAQKIQDVRWTMNLFQEVNLSGINAVREKFLMFTVSVDLMKKDAIGKESLDDWSYMKVAVSTVI